MMNVMKIKNVLAFGVTGLLLTGCSSGSNTAASLNERFSTAGSAVFVEDPSNTTFEYDPNAISSQASVLSISLALSIAPPATTNTGGTQLYASDLKVAGTKVITTYNVPGAVDKGWIDYVDVTTIALPLLLSSSYLADTDVNSVAMNNGNFSIVGAKDGVGSILRQGTYGLLGHTLGTSDTLLSSFAGTGVAYNAAGTNLAVTTGDAGGVSVMNASTLANVGPSVSVTDARGVAFSSVNNKYYVVSGTTNTAVTSYDTSGALVATRALTGASIAHSKATVVAGSTGEFLLVTTGDGGFNVVCASDMKIAASQAAYQYANYASLGLADPTQTVTNAAVFGPGMIFTASGEAGIRVYNFLKAAGASTTACQNITVSYLGYFAFSTPVSANNLYYSNVLTTALQYTGTLYVAAGAGGFKAVTITATRNALNDLIEF
ncbi:hypothetical protein [Bdellovibrio sp. HCB209]|uniref:hypothetical protein n=1 Tax=Bdellovibrio sp. HCB209 TaxID=3394354 RepID=UPI0039B50216